MKRIVFLKLFIMVLAAFCFINFTEVAEAKTRDKITFHRYVQSGKSYNLTKFLNDTERDSLEMKSIPKGSKVKWKTEDIGLKIKQGKLTAKKNGTYKLYAVTKNKKYVIQITAVSGKIGKIKPDEVQYVEVKETLAESKRIEDIMTIQQVCSKINEVQWKFSDTHSNTPKYGATYSISFHMESGEVRSFVVGIDTLKNQVYYVSSPRINIFEYVDALYKSL